MYDTERIKDNNDCMVIAEKYLGSPRGRTKQTLIFPCPFHAEKTPGGFHVYKDGYKCFSCGESGDVISFVMWANNCDFNNAIMSLGGSEQVSPERRTQIAREAAERAAKELEEKIKRAEKALKELREAQTWEKYHEGMNSEARRMWNMRGISDDFINLWQLGYNHDYALWKKENTEWVDWWHSPTLTIPIWGNGWKVNNVKHRLITPPPTGGKYHQERNNIPACPFVCNPDISNGPLFIAEGEIKAMNVFQLLDDPEWQVNGLPAARPEDSIWSLFNSYEPIYLCLDPDAKTRQVKNGKQQLSAVDKAIHGLGNERVYAIDLPGKIDDMIIEYNLDKSWIKYVIHNARKV